MSELSDVEGERSSDLFELSSSGENFSVKVIQLCLWISRPENSNVHFLMKKRTKVKTML